MNAGEDHANCPRSYDDGHEGQQDLRKNVGDFVGSLFQ